jgi:hypothetical protein
VWWTRWREKKAQARLEGSEGEYVGTWIDVGLKQRKVKEVQNHNGVRIVTCFAFGEGGSQLHVLQLQAIMQALKTETVLQLASRIRSLNLSVLLQFTPNCIL